MIGELVGMTGTDNAPLVHWANPSGSNTEIARAVVALRPSDIGRQIAMMFDNADSRCPIVIGLLPPIGRATDTGLPLIDIKVNGERLVVAAGQQLELRCGAASITLERDGKISIRGTQIVSHAEGINRIRGGAVHLN